MSERAGKERIVGDYIVGEDDALPPLKGGKRGYTTRGKVEQERSAAPAFTGKVRKWEQRWVKQGHLTVFKYVRVDSGAVAAEPPPTPPRPPMTKEAEELEAEELRAKRQKTES